MANRQPRGSKRERMIARKFWNAYFRFLDRRADRKQVGNNYNPGGENPRGWRVKIQKSKKRPRAA
jgi:hypothetical protein